jgi:cyclic pyranopterin phosphate synthase
MTKDLRLDRERLTDKLQRPQRDLRISVIDRCNFQCVYCLPKEVFSPDYNFLEREKLLSFEEIARMSRIFALLRVERFASPEENRFFADSLNVASQC